MTLLTCARRNRSLLWQRYNRALVRRNKKAASAALAASAMSSVATTTQKADMLRSESIPMLLPKPAMTNSSDTTGVSQHPEFAPSPPTPAPSTSPWRALFLAVFAIMQPEPTKEPLMPEDDSASADLRVVSVPAHLSDVVDTNDLFWRYDMDSYAANNHNEDRSQYVLERLPVPSAGSDPSANDMDATAASDASSVFFCGCYDGHGGEEAVEYVQRNLYRNIKQHLLSDSPSVTDAIVAGFQATDQQFHRRSLAQFEKGKWSSCSVGACAVVAMVVNQKLYVASCGDCRAIMAFRDPDGTLCVEQITLDHSANDAREQERLRILHPDELDIVREVGAQNFYVKGRLQPTRSLGDTYMKVQEVNRAPMPRGLRIRGSFTRPYISAVPDVFEVDLADRQPEFLVLGSDGLYGEMTNEEIASEVDSLRQQGVENVSQSLRTSVLERIAKYYGLSPGELEKIEPGDRRDYHDDITIDVLHFTAPACVAEEALPEAQAA